MNIQAIIFDQNCISIKQDSWKPQMISFSDLKIPGEILILLILL